MSLYFSGIQPTGNIHLGNYLGALKNWRTIQDGTNCLFCIVDMHAITVSQDPKQLRENIYNVAALYLACGIREDSIFVQSSISEHAELAWILSCLTPIGWMNRMTQFKDKTAKNKDSALVGLYTYPILMAADILLYKATHVPVGDDQKQHVEITRDIATLFNNKAGKEYFKLPEFVSGKVVTRVMSIRDATQKMSKSDPSEMARINLTDTDDAIVQKIKKAKTDSLPIPTTEAEFEGRPEVRNLMGIMSGLRGERDLRSVIRDYGGQNFAGFKSDLADALVSEIGPIRRRFTELVMDRPMLEKVMQSGFNKAKSIAIQTMKEVKEITGLF